MLWIIPGILISYLVGSIPTAYIFGYLLKGVDIRKHGSGNVGATNAMRVLGKIPGITVLALDILKGFITVILVTAFISRLTDALPVDAVSILSGISCICGHNWTIFLKFKGGKGVATTLGVLIAFAVQIAGLRLVLGLAVLTWIVVFLVFRTVSLASILTALAVPIYTLIFKLPTMIIVFTFILAFFILLRHAPNIRRLISGKEPRLF